MTAATWLSAAFGVAIAVVSAVGILSPQRLLGMARWESARGLGIGLRLVFGVVLLMAAPASSTPLAFRILGALALVAALGLAAMGSERFTGLVRWWLDKPPPFVRVWCASGLLFGAFIVYASLP